MAASLSPLFRDHWILGLKPCLAPVLNLEKGLSVFSLHDLDLGNLGNQVYISFGINLSTA